MSVNFFNVSVCIATYNGEKYILEQINSILNQISIDDEIIVVDDCSKDNTIDVIKSIDDTRIKIVINEFNLGVNCSFENAINIANNDLIILADQDDIWTENRMNVIKRKFEENSKISLVAGNSNYINSKGEAIKALIGDLSNKDSNRSFFNLFKIFSGNAPYYGCAIAFKKEFKNFILPFPRFIESHDLWIVKCAIIMNKLAHIEERLLNRRIHGENASVVSRNILLKIKSRGVFILSILSILSRKYRSIYAGFIR
jgi:glycosyltransferase involved in cell wall biosynthesis